MKILGHVRKKFLPKIFLSGILFIRVPVAFADTTYPNPIEAKNFSDLIKTIAGAVQQIGTLLGTVAIIFVGLRYVIAAASGSAAKIQAATKMLWYVLIGTVVVVGASYLAQVAVDLVKTLGGK